MWAALPLFPAQPAQDPRPITLVTAAIDSTAFFHNLAKVCPPPHRVLYFMGPHGGARSQSRRERPRIL